MERRSVIVACLCAMVILLAAGTASPQYSPTFRGQRDARIEEIELLPGIKVPVNIWEDDYVPTAGDFMAIGFTQEDAEQQAVQDCTWGQIKACYAGYYNDCCPKKTQEG